MEGSMKLCSHTHTHTPIARLFYLACPDDLGESAGGTKELKSEPQVPSSAAVCATQICELWHTDWICLNLPHFEINKPFKKTSGHTACSCFIVRWHLGMPCGWHWLLHCLWISAAELFLLFCEITALNGTSTLRSRCRLHRTKICKCGPENDKGPFIAGLVNFLPNCWVKE